MRVPDVIPECIAFLCIEEDGRYIYGGTAFYVGVRWEESPDERGFGYLITARHNVHRAFERHGNLFVRVNLRTGGADLIELPPLSDWLISDDDAVDVAALRFQLPTPFELYPVTNRMFADEEVIAREKIGIGEEVVVVGLFKYRHGSQRNLPIVRSGIVAAMPEEPLDDQDSGLQYEAYLVELRSIGGLSGSPVFVRLDPDRAYSQSRQTRYYLLGVIRGHWDASFAESTNFGEEGGQINAGVAIVTPVADISRILYRDDEIKERQKIMREKSES
jgi:hypothetical protein